MSTPRAGEQAWPACSLPYAPPEVVLASWDSAQCVVSPAHDIWALGIIVYEATTQSRALTSREQVLECARGGALYPWEQPAAGQPSAWRQSRLRSTIMPCLARDAAVRPGAAQVLAGVSKFGQSTLATTAAAGQ